MVSQWQLKGLIQEKNRELWAQMDDVIQLPTLNVNLMLVPRYFVQEFGVLPLFHGPALGFICRLALVMLVQNLLPV